MQAWRAPLLRFDAHGQALYENDGLLVTGPGPEGHAIIVAVGSHAELAAQFGEVPCTVLADRLLAPGFVDLHVHYPQLDVIGSPADGLLPWLNDYTFPHESRFSSHEHASHVAGFFLDELMRHGVSTALTFATSHPASVDTLFEQARERGLRLITGKVLQDRHSPDGVRDQTEQSLIDTEDLIARWHGVDRLAYAITPRFAPSSTEAQLRGAGELAATHPGTWIQSHVAENLDEIAWARQLFPGARSYLGIYADHGLMRERAIYAHCIHFDDADWALMRETHTAAAVCPTSNLFLGSGFFDFRNAEREAVAHGLASDVGGGTSFSPFVTMRAAYFVGREGQSKQGLSLAPERLWWLHTAGAAKALGLEGVVGNLAVGCDADFVILNPEATPLLARRTQQAENLAQWLFAMIILGDDRVIEKTVIASRPARAGHSS